MFANSVLVLFPKISLRAPIDSNKFEQRELSTEVKFWLEVAFSCFVIEDLF